MSGRTDADAASASLEVVALGEGWFPDTPGGLNRYLRDLHEALLPISRPRLAVLGPADHVLPGVSVGGYRGAPLPARLYGFVKFAREARRTAEIADSHFALYGLLPVAGPLRRLPLIVHFHGPWAAESRAEGEPSGPSLWIKRTVERMVYRRATRVIVLSTAFKENLVDSYGVSASRIVVLPPGVDLDGFQPVDPSQARLELGLPLGVPVAFTVRRLVERMGLEVLLEAWESVVAVHPDALLVVGGIGPLAERLEIQAQALGIGPNVRLVGRIPQPQLPLHYAAADLTVVPSIALEGFGLTILESLACGTPVVGTDVGGIPEVLRPLDPSLVVPAGDPDRLARRMLEGLSGTLDLPSRLACRSYAELHSWADVATSHRRLYEEVIGEHRRVQRGSARR